MSIGGKAPRTLVVLPESGFQAALPHGKFSILHCSIVALSPRLLLLPSGASREQVNGVPFHWFASAVFSHLQGHYRIPGRSMVRPGRSLHCPLPTIRCPTYKYSRDGPRAVPPLQSGNVVGKKNFFLLDYEMEWEYTIHWIRSRGEPTGFHKQIYLPDALILYGRHAATGSCLMHTITGAPSL